ncbi:copper chaperone PCu(A)C [Methylobacterium mesophilicum SR1.6/6]|uniref:Copper chaperone PCu(A)C n=1 Tax=Methylobacterium mesophilicum SR1.6/6 TaxID=908290 RepID=A0A6B9FRT1_9HYPH|nr:copper chaperone PCu(A)C [Methylobacterium mesophilicum]QGY05383.1 copper chaperone PCu(A)C [Methylobacterium mesophilicum SR1.6/6]
MRFTNCPILARAALGLAALLAATTAGAAADYAAGPLKIGHPWSRATPNGAQVAGGYLAVTNTGSEPDTLTGATIEEAGRAELHTMSMEGGVMKMAPVEGGLVIKPGETVTLKPGGYHLMFLDLKGPLKKGQSVKGTVTFAKAGTVPVDFTVEGIAAKAPASGAAEMDHGGMEHGGMGHGGHAH